MKLLVHRYIRKRMSPHRTKVAEGEHLEWHLYRLREAFSDLWHGMAEPQAQEMMLHRRKRQWAQRRSS